MGHREPSHVDDNTVLGLELGLEVQIHIGLDRNSPREAEVLDSGWDSKPRQIPGHGHVLEIFDKYLELFV